MVFVCVKYLFSNYMYVFVSEIKSTILHAITLIRDGNLPVIYLSCLFILLFFFVFLLFLYNDMLQYIWVM